jgi:hypothetical protein
MLGYMSRPLLTFLAGILLTPASASSVSHDQARPMIMRWAAEQQAHLAPAHLTPRGQVAPLTPKHAPASLAGSPHREIFGFVNAGAVSRASYRSWDFSLLSTVAFFDLHVDRDSGSLAHDGSWDVWHSAAASDLINTAHGHGVRVVLTISYHDDGPGMCTALDHGSTTLDQLAGAMLGADGVNFDYEGLNQPCDSGPSLRDKLAQFVRSLRARNLGYLSIDAYASSAEDSVGFFDIPSLAPLVDAFFVMDYDLERPNGPCPSCLGPTSPLTAGTQGYYTWNVSRSADDYGRWAGQTILGFPYYGVKGCTDPNPGPNAPVRSSYGADPYLTIMSYPSDSNIHDWSGTHRDAAGQEAWATYHSGYQNCRREEYWDDGTSLGRKYDLVNTRGFRGAGMFTLDYGGGDPDLWGALRSHFA